MFLFCRLGKNGLSSGFSRPCNRCGEDGCGVNGGERSGRNLFMLPAESEDTLAGVQLTSEVDYRGKLCSMLLLGGCNFRCPFCHNSSLVLDLQGAAISFNEVLAALHRRRGQVDAVTITGCEPTRLCKREK
ncbi:MAG: hypothetical protein ACYCV0_03490 [Desulfitobacteriaceae bacterium]